MKEINLKVETIKVESKTIKTDWKITVGKPVVQQHPIVEEYDKFINWLLEKLEEKGIPYKKHIEILEKHSFKSTSDKNKEEILNDIINDPEILKETRKEKLRILKIKNQIKNQFEKYNKLDND